jgi:hypothetical protein
MMRDGAERSEASYLIFPLYRLRISLSNNRRWGEISEIIYEAQRPSLRKKAPMSLQAVKEHSFQLRFFETRNKLILLWLFKAPTYEL